MLVYPSYLSSQNRRLTLEKLENTSCERIHVDVMDGKFVENTTPDVSIFKEELKGITKPLEIHLMVNDAKKYIEEFKELNPVMFIIHVELKNVKEVIDLIHSYGIQVGLAINPNTKLSKAAPYLKEIEQVLLMGVNPGMGGQEFIYGTVNRVRELYSIKAGHQYKFDISIDGGINDNTIGKVRLFTNSVVSGSYIVKGKDFEKQIESLR